MYDPRKRSRTVHGRMGALKRYEAALAPPPGFPSARALVTLFYGTPGLALIYSATNRWPGKGPQRVNGCSPLKPWRGDKFKPRISFLEKDPTVPVTIRPIVRVYVWWHDSSWRRRRRRRRRGRRLHLLATSWFLASSRDVKKERGRESRNWILRSSFFLGKFLCLFE